MPLLNAALGALDGGYDRDRARYAAVFALALAGAGEADVAVAVAPAKLSAELAAQTGSALAARELRRVRTVLRKAGADAALSELTAHLRAITATS